MTEENSKNAIEVVVQKPELPIVHEVPPVRAGKRKARKKAQSKTKKAGLIFPVGRIHRMMKKRKDIAKRVGAKGAVYMASVLEYLALEVLELAGRCATDFRAKSINPKHLQLAIRNDPELDELIKATIPGGGREPLMEQDDDSKENK